MTFRDVKTILKEIGFNMNGCAIGEKLTLAGDGVVVFREDGVYKVCDVERNVRFDVEEYDTEHDASKAFLMKLNKVYGDWYDFSKYVESGSFYHG